MKGLDLPVATKYVTMINEKPTDSEQEFYVRLLRAMSHDVANNACANIAWELERDIQEIEHRVSSEGMSFLTKTLPAFGKAIDTALSKGTPLSVPGFEKIPGTVIPRFLGALTREVFHACGRERSDASTWSVSALRQFCYLFYKLQIPYEDEQNRAVIDRFIATDEIVGLNSLDSLSSHQQWILNYAKNCISAVLGTLDPLSIANVPRHGPGAVATGEKGLKKGMFKRFYTELNAVFPYEHYFYFNLSHFCDDLQSFMRLKEFEGGTAKVVLVPKDSRGPRLISCEPLELQWIQQGLLHLMVPHIERHPLTRGMVNFADQSINRELARESSKDGTRVTLDMKDASDRVSVALVRRLFPDTWVRALLACRSQSTRLPDGRVLSLNKFAPMGSAVCFPVEALVFWALSVASIVHKRNVTGRMVPTVRSCDVYVYGDDIICNLEDHQVVMQMLESFGLLFNRDKCCTSGSFRESCGMDAYKGEDVTPLKIRTRWDCRLVGTSYPSWVSYHNWMIQRGYENVATFLREEISRVKPTPFTERMSDVVSFICPREMAITLNRKAGMEMRFCRRSHRLMVQGVVVRSRLRKAAAPGWAELTRRNSLKALRAIVERDESLERDIPSGSLSRLSVQLAQLQMLRGFDFLPKIRAYQYALPRQVTLRRGWGAVE